MPISHEAIYRARYIQGRGALDRELVTCLRTGRALRAPRVRSRLFFRVRVASCLSEWATTSMPSMSTITWPSACGGIGPGQLPDALVDFGPCPADRRQCPRPGCGEGVDQAETVGSEATGPNTCGSVRSTWTRTTRRSGDGRPQGGALCQAAGPHFSWSQGVNTGVAGPEPRRAGHRRAPARPPLPHACADSVSGTGAVRYSSVISFGPNGQTFSKRAHSRYAMMPSASQASDHSMGWRPGEFLSA